MKKIILIYVDSKYEHLNDKEWDFIVDTKLDNPYIIKTIDSYNLESIKDRIYDLVKISNTENKSLLIITTSHHAMYSLNNVSLNSLNNIKEDNIPYSDNTEFSFYDYINNKLIKTSNDEGLLRGNLSDKIMKLVMNDFYNAINNYE